MRKYKPKLFWRNKQTQRSFFIKVAAELGFDPLVPENWKHVTKKQLIAKVSYPKKEKRRTLPTK